MRLLLDTHALLWYSTADPQVSATASALIQDPANEVLVSPATFWEIAIKISIGKLALLQPYPDFLDACLNTYRFTVLHIQPQHLIYLANLPYQPNHKDPFDRMLVAQARVQGISILSADVLLDAYGITRLW